MGGGGGGYRSLKFGPKFMITHGRQTNTWQRHLKHKRLVTTELGDRGSNPGHMFTYFF